MIKKEFKLINKKIGINPAIGVYLYHNESFVLDYLKHVLLNDQHYVNQTLNSLVHL